MSLIDLKNYVAGKLVAPHANNWLDNVNPATGETYSRVPESDSRDVQAAVAAAREAFPNWSSLPSAERANWLRRLADAIDAHFEELAAAETNDNGKPIRYSRTVDIPRVSVNFRFFASMCESFASESHASSDGINYTLRQPIGVVTCISPWNLPLYLFTWKIAPALATGNCVVGKPSEVTPYTAFLLGKICHEIGFPAGVLNILHGSGGGVGNAIVTHEGIQAVSFTGGTKTGAHIAAQVAPRFKKLSLELGGKNPNIIFADCDYEQTLQTTLRSSFQNQGQICLCGSRVYVQRPIFAKFCDDLSELTKRLAVGDPMDPQTEQGAVVSAPHQQKILSYIELAKQEGGEIRVGGAAATIPGRCANGFFVQPTIITGLDDQCRTNQEEIFGPVITIQPFDDEDEVIARANSTPYGLSATIWTNQLQRAHRVAKALDVGVVWINSWLVRDLRTPFGGVKNSGVGREGGLESMRFFTEPKNVFVKY
ncbi:MAG TPA: aldehyde dehydrogenase [Pirellulaceae bacterium]|nr:aldehyde dehydrogenase [Pirellulaceae bacterium]HMP69585.1 aldehyde dehydrogenase [Pirellulaceae bacterium]